MQVLAFSDFAWLWISTEASPGCSHITKATVMQLNAVGPGCNPRVVNCFHSLRTWSTTSPQHRNNNNNKCGSRPARRGNQHKQTKHQNFDQKNCAHPSHFDIARSILRPYLPHVQLQVRVRVRVRVFVFVLACCCCCRCGLWTNRTMSQLIPSAVSLRIAETEQLYQAHRMIGGIGNVLHSTYSQTENG